MHQFKGSMSISQGIALQCATAFAVAIKVNVGIITISPSSTPHPIRAVCSPVVPDDVATPYPAPAFFAVNSSSSFTYSPTEEINVVSMQRFKYSLSRPSKSGTASGIISHSPHFPQTHSPYTSYRFSLSHLSGIPALYKQYTVPLSSSPGIF